MNVKKLIIATSAVIGINTMALNVDEFLPPAQANTPAQVAERSKVNGPVEKTTHPVTKQKVFKANNANDAINQSLTEMVSGGCEMIQVPSGVAWVATGIGTYGSYENPTATRISKRNAYVRAFMEAKKELAQCLGGMSAEGKNMIAETMEQMSDTKEDLMNFSSNSSEKLDQAIKMLLKGFVVYKVN